MRRHAWLPSVHQATAVLAAVLGTLMTATMAGCQSDRNVSPDWHAACIVERVQSTYLRELQEGALQYSPGCPPDHISLAAGTTISLPSKHPTFTGSSSRIFLTSDQQFAVKVVGSYEAYDGLCMERAVLGAIGTLDGGTVRVYPVLSGSMGTGDCVQRTMVTEFGGMKTVGAVGGTLTPSQVAQLAATMIRILQRLHAHGIIHGDIHDCQWVVADPVDVATVKLIDFGHSVPFIDWRTGAHIQNGDQRVPFPATLGPATASPFQLEGSMRSRRDDMYRLSEVLYRIRSVAEPQWAGMTHAEMAKAKREWADDTTHDGRAYTDFHHAMVGLGFDEDPEYSRWIIALTNNTIYHL